MSARPRECLDKVIAAGFVFGLKTSESNYLYPSLFVESGRWMGLRRVLVGRKLESGDPLTCGRSRWRLKFGRGPDGLLGQWIDG